jgi:hypothetical protein
MRDTDMRAPKAHDHAASDPRPDTAGSLELIGRFPRSTVFMLTARDGKLQTSRRETEMLVKGGFAWGCLRDGVLSFHPTNEAGLWDDALDAAVNDVVTQTAAIEAGI